MWVVLFLDNPCHRITLLWGQEPFVCLSKGSCWEMGSSWERIGKKDVCIFWKRLVLSSFLLSLLFAGKDWGQEEKGMTEEEMVGRHHQHSSHGFGWTPGVGDGQGGLAYCSSWGHRVRHYWVTELNWTECIWSSYWKLSTPQHTNDLIYHLSLIPCPPCKGVNYLHF